MRQCGKEESKEDITCRGSVCSRFICAFTAPIQSMEKVDYFKCTEGRRTENKSREKSREMLVPSLRGSTLAFSPG